MAVARADVGKGVTVIRNGSVTIRINLPPHLCVTCRHSKYIGLGMHHCMAHADPDIGVSYVDGTRHRDRLRGVRFCHEVNTDGSCPDWVLRPVRWWEFWRWRLRRRGGES